MQMLRWVWIGIIISVCLGIASAIAVYFYGHFAAEARGPSSYALKRSSDETAFDRAIQPLLATRPDQTAISLLESNVDAFAARALSARHAERSLDLLYYIWADDMTGRLLLHEILNAADRGVRVRLLVDDLGVNIKDGGLSLINSHSNVEVRLFNPTHSRPGRFSRGIEMALRAFSVTRRMHNKAWIADGRIGISGGRNIGDAYFDAAANSNFRDLDLLTLGPVTDQLESMFDEYWNSSAVIPIENLHNHPVGQNELKARRERMEAEQNNVEAKPYIQHVRATNTLMALMDKGMCWDSNARLISDPATKALNKNAENWIMAQLTPVMRQAQGKIEITSPYFIPGDDGVQAIVQMVQNGVDVSILTNSLSATDVAAVHGGYAPYRRPLLQGGVKIYELRRMGPKPKLSFRGASNASLHTKAFTMDGRVGFIGSVNFDPRSASLNTEMGVLFECPELIAHMEHLFRDEASPDHSYQLSLDEDGSILWRDESQSYATEPNSPLARRLFAWFVGLLPLESQL